MIKSILALLVFSSIVSNPLQASTPLPQERALIAYMKVKAGTENKFLELAQTVIKESRREPGNIRYQLHQSVTNPQQFVFYELYKTAEDLQNHRNSPHVMEFLKETKSITLQFSLEEYAPVGGNL